MSDAKKLLKNAFIDAECEFLIPEVHEFSPKFQNAIEKTIRNEFGLFRLINTAGKRIACMLVAILICLFSVACGIKEVRTPILKGIEDFFVNAKELLLGTEAENISDIFPSNVKKIIATSYLSENQNVYLIDEKEKITKFIELISQTYWKEPEEFEDFSSNSTYWTFDFFDKSENCLLTIKMANDVYYGNSKVIIIKGEEEKRFYISNDIYRQMLAFTNKRFYLHDSKLQLPDSDFSKTAQNTVLKDLNEQERDSVKKAIRETHYALEAFLLKNVSIIKEKDSYYWEHIISGETFVDSISGYETCFTVNSTVENNLTFLITTITDRETDETLKKVLKLWKKSIKNHNLGGLFEAHEYIHDYDYFAINYPTRYVYDIDADFQGIDNYFGRLENNN